MLYIKVRVVSLYRDFFPAGKFSVEIDEFTANRKTTVYDLVNKVALMGGKDMIAMLYLDDGTIDDWSRVLLNGRDIRFLEEKDKVLKNEDCVYIFSISAGG